MIKNFVLIGILLFSHGYKKSTLPASHFQDKKIDTSKVALIKILPVKPLIEKDIFGYYLNFDIAITNQSTHLLELSAIEASVIDIKGKLLQRKFINRSGQAPGIDVVGTITIKPGETVSIFNPFHTFTPDLPIANLKYGFFFDYADTQQQKDNNKLRHPLDFDVEVINTIKPTVYIAKNVYHLPLKGKMIVWDGHDFYSRHRRITIAVPDPKAKVLPTNSNRYAYDIMSVDETGSVYQNSPFVKENWFAYGKPVYAPSSGKVVEIQNGVPDNDFNGKTVKRPVLAPDADPLGMGNHIVIDHGNGEFSMLLHLKKGSIRVKVGQMVITDQELGKVGFSGEAIYPHLHYMVTNGRKLNTSDGLPSYFNNYRLYRGDNVSSVKRSRIDSGDIVEALN